MFRPARMVRLAIVAPRSRARAVIESLHGARVAHLEEYAEGKHPDLDLGEPLDEGSEASEKLVRIRALVRNLGLTPEYASETPFHLAQLRQRIDDSLDDLEQRVGQAVDARDEVAREIEARVEERGRLGPLRDLGITPEDLAGYDNLRVFYGEPSPDVADAVRSVSRRGLVLAGEQAQAIFAPLSDADRVAEVLSSAGFRELERPVADQQGGPVPERLGQVEADLVRLKSRLDWARSELDAIRRETGAFLLAAEEELSIEVDKADAPLAFGHTERAFVVDAWIPVEDEAATVQAVERAADGAAHIERLDEGLRSEHHRLDEPPTDYRHAKPVKPFTFFLDVFGTPKYGELDPTLILFLVFPLFFGFMIGDLGYGALLAVLGFFLVRRMGRTSSAMKGLGAALLIGGLWAAFFGGVVFHDAFGMAYVPHHEGDLAWMGIVGHHADPAPLLGFSIDEHHWATHPVLLKLGDDDVKSMLALSIIAAFVHLTLGFVFGFINHWSHSKKHAFAQVGWMFVLIGFFIVVVAMSADGAPNAVSDWLMVKMAQPSILTHAVPAIVVGAVVLLLTEGAMGAVEILGLLSHTVSYTRLAGIAVAKGALALAFNGMFLRDMVLNGVGPIIVVGIVLFILAQLLLFVLGILSAGIQAIRLNYVEFFLKFYQGGGRPFSPFGRPRRFTLEPNRTSKGV